MLILAPILEMQRKFRGQFLSSVTGSAESLESLSMPLVQPGPFYARKPTKKTLPIQRVPELVMSRQGAVREFLNSSRFNKVLPFSKAFAGILNLIRSKLHRRRNRPDGEALADHAGAFKNALLGRSQSVDLSFQHVLQRLGDTRLDLAQRRG